VNDHLKKRRMTEDFGKFFWRIDFGKGGQKEDTIFFCKKTFLCIESISMVEYSEIRSSLEHLLHK